MAIAETALWAPEASLRRDDGDAKSNQILVHLRRGEDDDGDSDQDGTQTSIQPRETAIHEQLVIPP